MKERILIYIICPYTLGCPAENVRKCIDAAEALLKLGFYPYAPLLNHFWHIIYHHSPEEWLDFDEAWLDQCEGVLRLPGPSAGGDRGQARAAENGTPVFDYIEELAAYFAPPVENEDPVSL